MDLRESAVQELIGLLRRAEGQLEHLGQAFSHPNFTDRYDDGPTSLAIAKAIRKEFKRLGVV